jgi:hypothetical protein
MCNDALDSRFLFFAAKREAYTSNRGWSISSEIKKLA